MKIYNNHPGVFCILILLTQNRGSVIILRNLNFETVMEIVGVQFT